MAYRQGDIVLVSFPFTYLSSSKRRPALSCPRIPSTPPERASCWRR